MLDVVKELGAGQVGVFKAIALGNNDTYMATKTHYLIIIMFD